jgi:hypothetical protein
MIVLAAGIREPIVECGPAGANQLFLICLLDASSAATPLLRPARRRTSPDAAQPHTRARLRAISPEKVE